MTRRLPKGWSKTGAHRARLASRNPLDARGRSHDLRSIDTRELAPRYLIVCEGARTEPNYFKAFRVSKIVRDGMRVYGPGYNTLRLVEEAIRLRAKEGPFDQVWCVFDRDDFPAAQFKSALALAKKEKIRAAYSNEAFELWYYLHFHYLTTGIGRRDYSERVSKEIGRPYAKNSTDMYDVLLARQPQAIKNARRLLRQYSPHNPTIDSPSTTVHLLVEELNQHLVR